MPTYPGLLTNADCEEFVERELRRAVDHPGELEPPPRTVDAGYRERRIDAVELAIRRASGEMPGTVAGPARTTDAGSGVGSGVTVAVGVASTRVVAVGVASAGAVSAVAVALGGALTLGVGEGSAAVAAPAGRDAGVEVLGGAARLRRAALPHRPTGRPGSLR